MLLDNKDKICAICEFRAYSGYGLKDSKDCIENWGIIESFIQKNNMLPTTVEVYKMIVNEPI